MSDALAEPATADPRPSERMLSALEAALEEPHEGGVTIGRLTEAFGPRAFGLLLILLNLPNVIFAPPALAGIAAVPTALFGVQMLLGQRRPWLPQALLDRPVAVPAIRRVLAVAGPWLARLEALGRPRLPWAAGRAAFRVFGLLAIVAALIVLIPVPGTNVLPAVSLVVMAVALIRGDGLLFLLGALLGLAGIIVAVAAAGLAVELLRWLWSLA